MDKKVRDLFVKIKPIFKKDIIIYKNSYIIAGELSEKEIVGKYLIEIDEKYYESLSSIFDSDKVYYVRDVVEFKDIDSHEKYMEAVDEIDSDNEIDKILNYIEKIKEKFSNDVIWKCITEIDKEVNNIIFEKKSIFDIMYDGDKKISIGKPLLPSVTEKLIDELYLYVNHSSKENESLGELLFDFHHTHFRLYMIYSFIPV